MKYDKHVFICTNQRAEGARKSCGEACGMELVAEFKKILKAKNLKGRMRAQKAGCLDTCDYGPSVVVYPEGVFYGGVNTEDVKEIVEQHLINDKPVERLMINFNNENQPA
ncbi:MAG: (2Fe-2S) ferredoxin domain-containing protein [Bacteroidetes bacterium]|nr:MAG: (2Fe-2S) ferredoxin domain-containing protein [Bacteroidota bacterium]REK00684.1 MAG: (2Fe-2S) ferredoxin domain-containing protein [Bacteroidota bacterium]REK35194.1 MAG: (2Fe-2S) ferredoxin domain-containing protein [Bacteroidota bacterium]REK48271.1 MAG: (2Fe-2S) ferredoxin domain-containing protein [Bacteroidota bacterium]